MLELRHFRYFIAVAEELHFGRAADRLCMTQPPLSMQIRQLEETIGAPLFARGHRPIELTAAGQDLLSHAREILVQADTALQSARLIAHGEAGHLSLAVTSASMLNLLPRLISAFSQQYPAVKITVNELVSRDQLAALLKSDINFGLIRPPINRPEIKLLTIHTEPMVVAIPTNHKLASLKKIPLSYLNQAQFINFDYKTATYFNILINRLLNEYNVRPNIMQTAAHLHTVMAFVAAGLGLALVPESATRIQIDDVVLKPLDMDDLPMAEICLAWNTQDNNPLIKTFLNVVYKQWGSSKPGVELVPWNSPGYGPPNRLEN